MNRPTRLRLEALHDRVTPNAGTLDPSFGGDGIVTGSTSNFAADRAEDVAVQPDGKIVAVGQTGFGVQQRPIAFRFNADGTPDATFGGGDGVALPPVVGGARLAAVVLQPDGKIVAAGTAFTPSFDYLALVMRLTAAGELDPTFGGGDGVVTYGVSPGDDNGFAVAVQPDGKIVLAGGAGGTGRAYTAAMLAVRLTADGAFDPTFAGDGVAEVAFQGTSSAATALLLDADGKIVLAGTSYDGGGETGFAVARLLADGAPDPAFGGGDGRAAALPAGLSMPSVYDAALQPDGRIVVAGGAAVAGGEPTPTVLRFTADGAFDPTFGAGGLALTDLPFNGGIWEAVALQADGRIITAGLIGIPGGSKSIIGRFAADGRLDTTFGPAGETVIPGVVATDTAPGDNDGFRGLALQADGKIVAAGVAGGGSIQRLSVARYAAADAPVAVADAYDIPAAGPLVASAADGVLANDFDGDGDALTAVLVTPPATGLLDFNADGSFTYTPAANFLGDVTFQYKATDGELDSAVQTVTLTRGPLIKVEGSTLVIVGTGGADALTLRPYRQWATGRILVAVELRTPAGLVRRTVVPAGGVLQFSLISVNMGGGNDSLNGTAMNRPFRVAGGAGNDTLRTGSAADVIFGDDGADVIYAGAGNDIVIGGGGADVIRGDAGNDLLAGGLGADAVNGGAGNDMLFDGTVAVAAPATDTLQKVLANYVPGRPSSLVEISQRLVVTPDDGAADTLTGSLGVDWFWTAAGLKVTDRLANEPENAII